MQIFVAVLLASLAIAGVGYAPAPDTANTPASQIQLRSIDDVLGTWEGTMDPPEEAPDGLEFAFVMDLEEDGDGIVGTFTLNVSFNGEEQSIEMDIIDGTYDDSTGEFTCEIVPPDDSDNGVLTATIDGDSMEGTMEGDGEETSFAATKN